MGSNVFKLIRQEIVSCELAPGAAIYEQELALRYGVSKSPVREALLRLQEQNLVEVRPRHGYRVRPISILKATEMYEMRQLLETAFVGRAVTHASDQQIDGLQQYLTNDPFMAADQWIALNRHFHSALALISGNSCMADAANRLADQFDRFTVISVGRLKQPIDWTSFNAEHRAITEALRARDKRTASAIMRAHVDASRQRTLQALTTPGVVA